MAIQGIESGCAAKEMTTLERCQELQQQNARMIHQLGVRLTQMLDRLRGLGPEYGKDEAMSPSGLLNDHLHNLELEAQRLGELDADLSALSRLL